MTDALDIRDLSISTAGGKQLARCERLSATRGQVIGVLGPSGSGKTTLLRGIAGALPNGVPNASGILRVLGTNVLTLPPAELTMFRRARIGLVGQDPAARLNPRMRVRHMLAETANESQTTVRQALVEVGLPDSNDLLRRRSVQLSGGQQRRVALARALVRHPDLLLLDEPTAGLDTLLRRKLGQLLRSRAERDGTTIVLACHDLSLIDELADEVVDLGGGGNQTPAGHAGHQSPPSTGSQEILQVDELRAWVGGRRASPVLHGIDLSLYSRDSLGVVGVSGAGKTTLARAIAGLHKGVRGSIRLNGETLHPQSERREPQQRRRIQLIPQDSLGTLNPSRSVAATLQRPLRLHQRTPAAANLPTQVGELLDTVGLPDDLAGRYPHELSGGQRQRVAIARALATKPDILVCDEITSSMDTATADAIMSLLGALRIERDLALIMITHEISVVAAHTDSILVLDEGRVAETGVTAEVLRAPSHSATAALSGTELVGEQR